MQKINIANIKENITLKLHQYLHSKKFDYLKTPIIQPIVPLLELMHQNDIPNIVRFHNQDGKALCLRADFTIQVAQHFVQNNKTQAKYFYHGYVFENRKNLDVTEKHLIGVEIYRKQKNLIQQEAEIIAIAIDALENIGIKKKSLVITITDINLINRSIQNLKNKDEEKKYLLHLIDKYKGYRNIPNKIKQEKYNIKNQNNERITELLQKINENTVVTGLRDVQDIKKRLQDKIIYNKIKLSKKTWDTIDNIANMEKFFPQAISEIENIQQNFCSTIELAKITKRMKQQMKALQKQNISMQNLLYTAEQKKHFQYYDTFIFEIFDKQNRITLARGGRYDSLVARLADEEKEYVSACGFSLFTDHILQFIEGNS